MRTSAKLAGTAVEGAGSFNVGFLSFSPEICLSGHDNIADISGGQVTSRKWTFV
jgi:hypothetical protein